MYIVLGNFGKNGPRMMCYIFINNVLFLVYFKGSPGKFMTKWPLLCLAGTTIITYIITSFYDWLPVTV